MLLCGHKCKLQPKNRLDNTINMLHLVIILIVCTCTSLYPLTLCMIPAECKCCEKKELSSHESHFESTKCVKCF